LFTLAALWLASIRCVIRETFHATAERNNLVTLKRALACIHRTAKGRTTDNHFSQAYENVTDSQQDAPSISHSLAAGASALSSTPFANKIPNAF